MKRIALTTLLLLTACQRGPADGQGPQGSEAAPLEPGEWESRVEILDIKMLPIETTQGSYTPQLVRHSPPTTSKSCLTADQAKAPSERFLAGVAYSQCQSDKFTMAEGRIGGTVTCTGQGQATNFTLEGRYTATSYEVTTRAEVRAAGEQLPMMPETTPMDLTTRITAKRVGECPEAER
jgi:hypothetical protein